MEIVARHRSGQEVRVVIRCENAGGSGTFCVYLKLGNVRALVPLVGGLSLCAAHRESKQLDIWLAEADRKEA